MLIETEQNLLNDVAIAYNFSNLELSIIKKFVSLDEADRKVILDFVLSITENEDKKRSGD